MFPVFSAPCECQIRRAFFSHLGAQMFQLFLILNISLSNFCHHFSCKFHPPWYAPHSFIKPHHCCLKPRLYLWENYPASTVIYENLGQEEINILDNFGRWKTFWLASGKKKKKGSELLFPEFELFQKQKPLFGIRIKSEKRIQLSRIIHKNSEVWNEEF